MKKKKIHWIQGDEEMNNMTKNNSLIEVSNNSIFFRIKNFFMNLFRKNKIVEMQQENIIMNQKVILQL